MQEQSMFSSQLRKYLSMMIKIWPSLRAGARDLADVTGPHEQSLVPRRNYRTMTESMFFQTIIKDLHQFIMQHDVKQEDIEDYLNDILDMLSIDEDLGLAGNKVGSVRYMSREVIKVITELQQGRTQMVENFETNVYNVVLQMGVGDALQQKGYESLDEQEDEDQMDEQKGGYQSEQDEWDEEDQDEQQQKGEKKKTEEQIQKQQQLQDDGWVIVKKKK